MVLTIALVVLAVLSILGNSYVQLTSVAGMAVALRLTRGAPFGRRAVALLVGGVGASLLAELVHVIWHLVRQDQPGHLGFWFSAVVVGLINVAVMLLVSGGLHLWNVRRAGAMGVTLGLLCGASVFGGAMPASAQPAQAGFRVVAPAFMALLVEDLPRSVDWYRSVFGLDEVRRVEDPAGRFTIVLLAGDALRVELIHRPDATRAGTPAVGHFKAGVFVGEIEAAHAWFQRHGHQVDARVFLDEALRVRTFVVRDPEGNRVQLMSPCGESCVQP